MSERPLVAQYGSQRPSIHSSKPASASIGLRFTSNARPRETGRLAAAHPQFPLPLAVPSSQRHSTLPDRLLAAPSTARPIVPTAGAIRKGLF
jgi:hypothetical protein